ncbi:AAA family ATPase [Acinetobacter pollinis]|uniref:AAA family ATPase n=1 Tax=Acinetobacter pollinis TaxID=2605270 RepID=A0ABU6DSS7_9GAMM|nr:AAA family ATPase [Acinetobacter pollinis]MEB5475987.1 AAA family ATPase [Acinetobacter pollinis]
MQDFPNFLRGIEILETMPNEYCFFNLYPMTFNKNITLLIGENGIGKSTLLESLAIKLGCPAEGGSRNFQYKTEDTHFEATEHLRLIKTGKLISDIFFYRSETYYNFMTEMRKLDEDIEGGTRINTFYGGKDLHLLSHGQSMKALYQNRFKKNGLYIMDEPEASLSAESQIDLISKIYELSLQGTQFIIATHSPILMAIPNAEIIEIGPRFHRRVKYKDTSAYYFYKKILDSDTDFIESLID